MNHKSHLLQWTTFLALLGVILSSSASLFPIALAQPTPAPVVVKPAAGNSLRVGMKELGDPQGYRLKTVRTQRDYPFTRPKGWKVSSASNIRLSFQHGSNLLPERSSLNVLVNNRILKSIPLGKNNIMPTTVTIPVPPELLKDNNILSYQVDQHYTYKCEDPFSEELWTEVLPDTALTLNYSWDQVHPDLAQYPFPLLDELNNYTPTTMTYVLPSAPSDEALEAFGVVAAHLGQQAKWRDLKPSIGDAGSLQSNENLILVGSPSENDAIASLGGGLDLPLSGGKFADKSGTTLPDDYGVLQLIPNPYNRTRSILIVSGNGPAGVKKAAHLLAQGSLNKILVGRSAIVKDYQKGADYPFRAWDGFILQTGDNFDNLGLKTQTARGITALPIFYQLKLMPDISLPGKQKVKLHTVYSYASQLDSTQSKLEVLLNGKAIKSVPLDDKNGKSLADLTIEIPTEEFHTFNDLEYRFHVYPEKYDLCRFVTDVHIWGTVHNTSYVEFPGEIKAPLPDVGLINDGGYPFTAYQDMSRTAIVMPDTIKRTDLEAMLQFVTRMGRESASRKGIELAAYHASKLPDEVKKDRNLVIIGQRSQNKLFDELKYKAALLTEGTWNTLQEDQKNRMAQLSYTPGQGIVEELLSPWNENRVALLLTGENDTALVRDAQLFEKDVWFKAINQGNLTVVNDTGPKSAILLSKGEARFFYAQDQRTGFQMPSWGWIAIGFFSLLGVISVIRFLFGR
ncbi:cellulose biosynthesis cyclic di-GMP-binding regulatory protein BcsB [Vampirovibrio sp.]|uniref:cellulose biosynthesis cyclic di-GMP-binding regulatory protein BcsB n=1 Tax=Vampirovibrio sp. TaxID=2717857 RepID=UPI0035938B8A